MNVSEKVLSFFQEMIEKKKGFLFYLFWPFLKFFSFFYFVGVEFKNFLYDQKFIKPKKIYAIEKIISIGNIVVGGTGKTPFTIFLAKKIIAKGYKVAIISKGYGSNNYKLNISKKFTYATPNILAKDVGDEPYLISQNVPEALVVVGRDKRKSLKIAEEENVDIAILDDGFQSRYVFRDIDIVLLDGVKPFSNGSVLPSGFLRESKKNIKRADLIVYTSKDINYDHNFDKKALHVKFYLSTLYKLKNGRCKDYAQTDSDLIEPREMRSILKKELAVFCAIAKPKSFVNMLKRKGCKIVDSKYLFDHSTLTLKDLKLFALSAKVKGAKYIITTEKDAVKLSANIDIILPIYYTRLDLEIIYNKNILDDLLDKM